MAIITPDIAAAAAFAIIFRFDAMLSPCHAAMLLRRR